MLSILYEGWLMVPHSYAIVATFQLQRLLQRSDLRIYYRPLPLYQTHWKTLQKEPMEGVIWYTGTEPIDVVYRIAFPYHIHKPDTNVPVVVFGTSETTVLTDAYFIGGLALAQQGQREGWLHFITPSTWSQQGFIKAGLTAWVLPHGVETTLYKPIDSLSQRDMYRKKWMHLSDPDAFVFFTMGSCCGNKNMDLLLQAFTNIHHEIPHAYLLIKGIDSLYASATLLDRTLWHMVLHHRLNLAYFQKYVQPYVLITCDTLEEQELAELFQASDCYVAPYSQEGFVIPVLNASACGLPSIVSQGGPTDDFTTQDTAFYINTTCHTDAPTTSMTLHPSLVSLQELMLHVARHPTKLSKETVDQVHHDYSWNAITSQLVTHLASFF